MKNLEEDYEKHSKRVKEIVARKSAIFEKYNKLIAEKKLVAPKLVLKSSANMTSGNNQETVDSLNKSIAFKVSNLTREHIFKLDLDEIKTELKDLHDALFKCSSVNFSGKTTDTDDEGDFDDSLSQFSFSTGGQGKTTSTRVFEYRNPRLNEEGKYIKESQPFGNPFKLIIRPKHQNIQMNEMEDEAFNTKVVEKKKASRLASFANLYKQKMAKKLSEYSKYHKENKDVQKMNLRLKEIQMKHEESKKRKQRREEELRNVRNIQAVKTKMFLKRRGLDELPEEEREQEEDYQVKSLVKAEKFDVEDDPNRFKASVAVFNDLFDIFDLVQSKMSDIDDGEWSTAAHCRLRNMALKFEECFEEEILNHKMRFLAKDYLNIEY